MVSSSLGIDKKLSAINDIKTVVQSVDSHVDGVEVLIQSVVSALNGVKKSLVDARNLSFFDSLIEINTSRETLTGIEIASLYESQFSSLDVGESVSILCALVHSTSWDNTQIVKFGFVTETDGHKYYISCSEFSSDCFSFYNSTSYAMFTTDEIAQGLSVGGAYPLKVVIRRIA